MESRYDRLGDILRDKLASDEDPFETWEPHAGKKRTAGNVNERTPPPGRMAARKRIAVPDELIEDFRVLGLPPGVSSDECKAAWKHLLKKHHPDRNDGDPAVQARQAQITARLTDSYRKILTWYESGALPN